MFGSNVYALVILCICSSTPGCVAIKNYVFVISDSFHCISANESHKLSIKRFFVLLAGNFEIVICRVLKIVFYSLQYHDLFQPYICYCAKQKVCLDYMKLQYTENELFKTFVIVSIKGGHNFCKLAFAIGDINCKSEYPFCPLLW